MEGAGTYLIRKHEAQFLQLKANEAQKVADAAQIASSFSIDRK
jgi:hypothetical protein